MRKEYDFSKAKKNPFIACESKCKRDRDNSYIDCSILSSEGDGFMKDSPRTTCENNADKKFDNCKSS